VRGRGQHPVRFGLIALVVTACAVYMGFAKRLPWAHEYTLKAVVTSVNYLHRGSPVRIAGVNVGRVTAVRRGPGTTGLVTMAISDAGRPVHSDATLKIRPRLFLEGNFFVDLEPGTPAAPELPDGGTIPLGQTATPVQLDEVLSMLAQTTRVQLRSLLAEYARALDRGGAEGVRRSFGPAAPAFAGIARLAEDSRGVEAHDLSQLLGDQAQLFGTLNDHAPALQGLVGNLNRTLAALAHRSSALTDTLAQLDALTREAYPALGAINASLPALRAFSRESQPALRAAPRTLDDSHPFLVEARRLLAPSVLPPVVRQLRPATRSLLALEPALGDLFGLVSPVSACVRDHVLPVLNAQLDDGSLSSGQPVWQELLHSMVGLASAAQDFDGNGTAVRYLAAGGDQLVSAGQLPSGTRLFGLAPAPIEGSRPARPPGPPPFVPSAPCERQPPLDLGARAAPAPAAARGQALAPAPSLLRRLRRQAIRVAAADRRAARRSRARARRAG